MLAGRRERGKTPVTPVTPVIAEHPPRFEGRVVVDARYAGDFEEAMFEPAYWQDRDAVVGTAGGRGKVLFVTAGDEQWVLRHYHRGGLMTSALGDLYLWTGARNTRATREFALLAELHAEGLPVPRPVAARHQRERFFYRGDLITARIETARSLASIAEREVPPAETWRAIGACIRRFHDAGVFHADLNAHNIVIDAAGSIYLVDFDRGRRLPSGPWKRANLRRLNRSLNKIGMSLTVPDFEKNQWQALNDGYAAGA